MSSLITFYERDHRQRESTLYILRASSPLLIRGLALETQSAMINIALSLLSLLVITNLSSNVSGQPLKQKEPQSSQRALDFKSKLGVGYGSILGDPDRQLLIQWGAHRLFILELTGGFSKSSQGDQLSSSFLGLGLGGHFQLIQARDVAGLTIGVRVKGDFGQRCDSSSSCTASIEDDLSLNGYGLALPMVRLFWFPNRYISLHAEFGVHLQFDVAQRSFPGLLTRIDLFRAPLSMGHIGFILWI
jgi:hypothetical protein